MAIIDNVLSDFSYGKKYSITYYDNKENRYTLEIYKKDYSGSNNNLLLAGDGIQLQKNFLNEDSFNSILPTFITLELVTATVNDINFREFAFAHQKEYWVKLKRASTIIFSGYLLPETYQENLGNYPIITTIQATDALGLLKDIKFLDNDEEVIRGIERIKDVVSFILYKVGLRDNQYWLDAIPIYPWQFENSNYGCFYNTYIEVDRYGYDDKTCEDVLNDILSTFNASITQVAGNYLIRSYMDVAENKVIWYTRNGSLITYTGTYSDSYEISTLISSDGKISGRIELSVDPIYYKINLIYDKPFINLARKRPFTDWSIQYPGSVSPKNLIEVEEDHISYNPKRSLSAIYGNWVKLNLNRFGIDFPAGYLEVSLECMLIYNGTYTERRLYVFPYHYTTELITISDTYQQYNSFEETYKWHSMSYKFLVEDTIESPLGLMFYLSFAPSFDCELHIRNLVVECKIQNDESEYPTNYEISRIIGEFNTRDITINKPMFHRALNYNKDAFVYDNCLFSKNGSDYVVTGSNWRYKNSTFTDSFTTYILYQYLVFLEHNRPRVKFTLVNTDATKYLLPYTVFGLPDYFMEMNSGFTSRYVLMSFNWNIRLDVYEVELMLLTLSEDLKEDGSGGESSEEFSESYLPEDSYEEYSSEEVSGETPP